MTPRALFFCFMLTGFGMPHIDGKVESGRYFSPGGEFSVSISPIEWPREKNFPDQLFVDFYFKGNDASWNVFGIRYVEWLRLRAEMQTEDFSKTSSSIIAQHVAKHFGEEGKFKIQDSKFIEGSKNPTLAFVALGTLRGQQCHWQGAVILFGDRIAFLGFLTPESAIGAKRISSVEQLSPPFLTWLTSLQRVD